MKTIFNVKNTLTTYLSIFSSSVPMIPNESCQSEAVSANNGQAMGKFHFAQSQPIAIPDIPNLSQCKMNSVAIGSGRKSPLEFGWNVCGSDERKYINSDESADQEETNAACSGSESSYAAGFSGENIIDSDKCYEPKEDERVYPRDVSEFNIELYPLNNPLTVIEEEDEEEISPARDLRGVERGSGKFLTNYHCERGDGGLRSKDFMNNFANPPIKLEDRRQEDKPNRQIGSNSIKNCRS
jgi:hypothetical protein